MNLLRDPCNLVYFAGFIAYLQIRAVYARRTRRQERIDRRIDALEKALLLLVIPSSALLPVFYLFTPLLDFADYRLPGFVRWCGVVVMLFALWLFWRSHSELGQNWSVSLEVRKGHELVQDGVYRRIRHPMYAAIWLFSAAQAMLLPNWLVGWSALVAFAPMYFLRTPREEKMMCEHFGPEYRDYMGQTGRLWPRFKRRSDVSKL